jgi:penicillin-binding protein 1A
MMASGESWHPTQDQAPQFCSDARGAPRVISAENAFLIYDMMRDVIRRGTGRRARDLGRTDIAGKTGTSNERRDAWFSGFNGALVATAWVGFDQERSLGEREEGGQTALPMWKYFMARALRRTPEAPLPQPPTLITARISPDTGLLAAADDSRAIFELFRTTDLAVLESPTPGSAPEGGNALQAGDGTDIF